MEMAREFYLKDRSISISPSVHK